MEGFWRLLSRIKKYKKQVTLSIISNILLAVFSVISMPLVIPFLQLLFGTANVVSERPDNYDLADNLNYHFSQIILTYGNAKALGVVCILIVIVFFLKNLFRYLALFFMAPVRNGIIRDVRSQLFDKYLKMPLSFFTEEKKGDLMSRMLTDVQEIEWSVLNVLEAVFKAPIMIIGNVALLLYLSPKLTAFVFVLLLLTGVVLGNISKTLKKSSMEVQTRIGRISSILEESLGGLRIIKGFNGQHYLKQKFNRENEAYKNVLTRLLWRKDLSSPLSEFLGIVVVTVLLWFGSLLVFRNELLPETFIAFLLLFYGVIDPSKLFSSAYYNIQKGLAAIDRVDALIHMKNEITELSDAKGVKSFDQSIVFKGVRFTYAGMDHPVLDTIDLEIKKGETTAIVGASGAGKSTLVDLIPRFYDVSEGNIEIDGVDIKDLKIKDLRSLFGIVSQDAILFNDSVRNNILFGEDKYSDEALRKAAEISNAHDFITELSEGYDTNIGDRGSKLSGGQKQRLTIARAVLRDPPILILDEATSALDSESEKLVQDALQKIMKSRTSVVIAHRLSTIKNAHKIVVLEKGKIVEMGTHEALIQKSGAYKKFAEMQTFN